MINLFQVLPATFIQESLETREQYENVDALYKIDNEVRLALLDLIRLGKLKLFYGIVYAFGLNDYGQLGTNNINNKIPTPIDYSMITDGEGNKKDVIQVSAAAGAEYSLLLCKDGTVYAFGLNGYGGLGIGNTRDVVIPTPINTSLMIDEEGKEKRVIQVSAGENHSLLLCEDGSVYSSGYNKRGQLGIGDTNDVVIPTPIDTSLMIDEEGKEKKVIQVSAGVHHSLILCEDGTVYVFGTYYNIIIPTAINTLNIGDKRVIQISSCNHSLILCEDGTVYSFGLNFSGELGIDNINDDVEIPTAINTSNMKDEEGKVKKVIQVSAGYHYSLILCEDGTVYSFGSNCYGQLGIGGRQRSQIVPTAINTSNMKDEEGKVMKVIQVFAGFRHSFIVSEGRIVFSFGWNEYGQLGTGIIHDEEITIPTAIDTSNIGSMMRVIDISVGYAHSLLLT